MFKHVTDVLCVILGSLKFRNQLGFRLNLDWGVKTDIVYAMF